MVVSLTLGKKIRFVILRTVLTAIRGDRGHALRTDDINSDINLIEHIKNDILLYPSINNDFNLNG